MRGATTHYDAVVSAATSGCLNAGVDTGVPVVFGVLTCDTMEQVRQHGRQPHRTLVQSHCLSMWGIPHCVLHARRACTRAHACTCRWHCIVAQALDRAGGKVGNKGGEAAITAIEMANLMASLRADGLAAPAWGPAK